MYGTNPQAPVAEATANAEVAARLLWEYEEHFGTDAAGSWTAYWAGDPGGVNATVLDDYRQWVEGG